MHQNSTEILLSLLASLIVLAAVLLFFIIAVIRLMAAEKKARRHHNSAIVEYEERIKAKLAAELHDEFGASLAAITIQLQGINTRDKNVLVALQKTESYIASLNPKLRNIFHNLMPPELEKYGLRTAIYSMIEKTVENGRLKVQISLTSDPPLKHIQLHIYRIIQELFTNILKHAQASECAIELKSGKDHFVLKVKDNGKGYDSERFHHSTGSIGMINVCSRVNILNASIKLKTAPGRGTEYIIEIPRL